MAFLGYSLPSNLAVASVWAAWPSAFTPSVTILIPPVTAMIFVVGGLFGAGPGLNLDFARFIFQVPTNGSFCAHAPTETRSLRKSSMPNHERMSCLFVRLNFVSLAYHVA